MSDRTDELLVFYQENRIVDQLNFYARRRTQFDRAAGQAMALSATLLGFATAAGALAGTDFSPIWFWSILATIFPALATSIGAYSILYAFEYQSKLYADAVRAVRAAARPAGQIDPQARPAAEDAAELVKRVEAALRQEQAQWGQLTSQIQIADDTRA